jgi:CelD/BcsL family acetyltransferase involved in cellulose biosynthesis
MFAQHGLRYHHSLRAAICAEFFWHSNPQSQPQLMSWQLISASRFADHAAAWDALQRRTTDTPFLESLFIEPLLQEFGTGRELLALHNTRGAPDAAALVRPTGRGMWETFQPSQLPLGPWLSAVGDDVSARLSSLLLALPGPVLGLGVTQLDPRLVSRPAETENLRLLDYIRTPYIEIQETFAAYWQGRGKNLRQNTRKQRSKLESEGILTTLECITAPELVPEAMQDYGALESAGWKAGTGTAIHPDNAQGRFYTRMLQNFCAQGRGRIYRYRFGAKVVSMDLCIDNGPLVVILKTAYDESFRAVSPSTLMRHDQFNSWWDEGRYRHIEFYGKTMEWHTRWAEQERGLFHATLYRWPWLRGVHEQLINRRAKRARRATAVEQTEA